MLSYLKLTNTGDIQKLEINGFKEFQEDLKEIKKLMLKEKNITYCLKIDSKLEMKKIY
jgi:hypothetical protein